MPAMAPVDRVEGWAGAEVAAAAAAAAAVVVVEEEGEARARAVFDGFDETGVGVEETAVAAAATRAWGSGAWKVSFSGCEQSLTSVPLTMLQQAQRKVL
jgi:hypothetical protein